MTKKNTRIYGLAIPAIFLFIFFAFAKNAQPVAEENINFECIEYLYTFHDDPDQVEYATQDKSVIKFYNDRVEVVYHFYPCKK